MKPTKGKWYWVRFGYEVYRAKCIAETECGGGIFEKIGPFGPEERPACSIAAESDAPEPKLSWLRRVLK